MNRLSKKKILILVAVCLVFSLNFSLSAEKKTIIIGGKVGWSQLSVKKSITTGKGRYGYDCLQLATNSRTVTSDTDMLIDFEGDKVLDRKGNYTVVSDSLVLEKNGIMGSQSAVSRGNGHGLILHGTAGSLFGTEGPTGSFLIEFWLKPSLSEDGEELFFWQSSRTVDDTPVYQMITAVFRNNHIEWRFRNVFDGYTLNDGEVCLQSYRTIVPDVWTHQIISYNESDGLLEYRIDGNVEALCYVTSSGHEEGTVYTSMLGVPSDVQLCSQYTGSIDDFHIVRTHIPESGFSYTDIGGKDCETDDDIAEDEEYSQTCYDTFKTEGGRFETQPLPVAVGSTLDSIDAVMNVPPQTAIDLYVRSGDNFFGWTDSNPKWILVTSGAEITGVIGKYFQIAGNLFPDGAGKTTPSVTEITVNYTEQPLPLPPFTISAKPGNGSVTVTWSYSVDDLSGGYYVYYGTRPGEYLGQEAVQGPSPVNVGNTTSITLTGLKNGTIYYFAVSSWSRFDSRISGDLSDEVYARPREK